MYLQKYSVLIPLRLKPILHIFIHVTMSHDAQIHKKKSKYRRVYIENFPPNEGKQNKFMPREVKFGKLGP